MIKFLRPKFRHVCVMFFVVVLLLCGIIFLAVTPYALRELWLPAVARSAGVVARAGKIRLRSLIPFRIQAVDFHYEDTEIKLDISSISTLLRLSRLKKHEIELYGTRIDGIRIRSFPARRSAAGTGSETAAPAASEPSVGWSFSMQEFEVKNAFFEYENDEHKVVQIWSVKSLNGNRFKTGEICSVTADASLRVHPDKHNPMEIRVLPFQIRADYLLDADYWLKSFDLSLQTGICDLSITDEIAIPIQAGIRASVRMKGEFPDPETFRIISSETHLFKGEDTIGKLEVKGENGKRFQFDGQMSDLDMQPYLSILSPGTKVSLKLPRGEFAVTGTDFSQTGLRKDLKVRVIAQMRQLSIPIELNQKNRLIRLVMIPVEAMPSLLEIINLKWDLNHEFNQCVDSIQAVISGKQNLNFDRAEFDTSLENGILNIRNFTLHGRDIEMESIRGTLELATEKMDLETVLIVSSVKLPLKFKGTLSQPSPHFKNALKDFVLLNAPLLKNLEALLKEPPSPHDTKLEKAIKRGYRDLQKSLQ